MASFLQYLPFISTLVSSQEAQNFHTFLHYLQDFAKFYGLLQQLPAHLQWLWICTGLILFMAMYDIKVGLNKTYTPASVRPLRTFLRYCISVVVLLFLGLLSGFKAFLGGIILLLFRDRYYLHGGFLLLCFVSVYTLCFYYEIPLFE